MRDEETTASGMDEDGRKVRAMRAPAGREVPRGPRDPSLEGRGDGIVEPSSDASTVQSEAWRAHLDPSENPRIGQARVWTACMRALYGDSVFAVLPTGYGKTKAACGAFAILRARGLVTHMLVMVPYDTQREQWVEKAVGNFASLGVKIRGAIRIAKESHDLRYAEPGGIEVFVATYAQLLADPGYWQRLMNKGSWFVVRDECHHLGEEGKWAEASTTMLTHAVRLDMSATPVRTDRRLLVGVNTKQRDDGTWELVPTVRVSMAEALHEEAVRWPELRKHHYAVQVSKSDGSLETLTTESLTDEARADFDVYETKYQLRYRSEYLSSMLIDACNELATRNMRQPGEHQMLVFCMTQRHADFVCQTLNGLDGRESFAEWIGMDRPKAINEMIMERYAGGKTLCLVQVDKAGEGFDHPRASVLVFLNLVRSRTKTAQQIGRGLRRNYAIAHFVDDTCVVFASADSAAAEGVLEIQHDADESMRERVSDEGESCDVRVPTLPSISVLSAEFERCERLGPGGILDETLVTRGADIARAMGRDPSEFTPEQLANGARMAARDRLTPSAQDKLSEDSLRTLWSGRVESAVGTIARYAVRTRSGELFSMAEVGDAKHAIHTEWIRASGVGHKAMTASEYQRKYEWLGGLLDLLAKGHRPSWL